MVGAGVVGWRRRMAGWATAATVALLTGCGGAQDGSTAGESSGTGSTMTSLGVAEVVISGIGSKEVASEIHFIDDTDPGQDPARAKALQARTEALSTLTSGLALQQLSTNWSDIGTRGAGGVRYVSATFRVRNAVSCSTPASCTPYATARRNLTFIAAATANTKAQTAIGQFIKFDGTAAQASLALDMKPSHGADGLVTGVDGRRASLQVYRESELPTPLAGVTSLMHYGFVVHNVNDGSRLLPASPANDQFDGIVTFAFKIPLQSSAADDPFKLSVVLQVTEDSETRVTQSLDEADFKGDAAAEARAATAGASDLTVLCSRVAQVFSGNPICDVRTAGTAASPAAYLVNNGGGAPRVAAAPIHRIHVDPRQAIVLGTSAAMSAPTIQSLVVQGSQSGRRTLTGAYAGTLDGGGSSGRPNQLIWRLGTGDRPFFPGETVSFTATAGNLATGGAALTPFVGSFTVAGSSSAATGEFSVASNQTIPAYTRVAASGDFNGDGFIDLVLLSDSPGRLMVYLNDQSGGFGNPAYTLDIGAARSVAVGDLNGDGKADIVVTSGAYAWATVLLGNGSGGFTAGPGMVNHSGVTVGGGHTAIRLVDVNEDGILDLVTARAGAAMLSVFTGSGDGGFGVPQTWNLNSIATDLEVGDLNADGHVDVVAALGSAAKVQVYLGTGFTIAPTTSTLVNTSIAANHVALGFVDGDQRLDLVVAAGTARGGLASLLGNGAGGFGTAAVTANLGAGGGLKLADVDGDGMLDAVMADGAVWKGGGNGSFAYQGAMSTRTGLTAVLEDLDNDGNRDLVVLELRSNGAAEGRLRIFRGNGVSGFEGVGVPAGLRAVAVALGDLNGDGILDAVVADAGGDAVLVLKGLGNGQFAGAQAIAVGSSPEAVVLGDFDGDGRLDVAVTNSGSGTVSILLGNGTGGLGSASSFTVGGAPFALAVGDLNGDGRLDLVTANGSGDTVGVLLGNGSGGFTAAASVAVPSRPMAVALTDLNLDGKLDLLVVTADNGRVSVLLGNGSGGFGTATTYAVGSAPLALAVGDLNTDGIPDVVVANTGSDTATVLFGRSDGTLGGAMTLATDSQPIAIALADIQGDGRLDVLITNSGASTVSVFRNGGVGSTGVLSLTAATYGIGVEPNGIAMGDLNADGKLELVSVHGSGRLRVASDF